MPADNKLELVIQVDAAGANASIKSVNKSLSGLEKGAVSSAKGASKGIDGMTLSMTKAVVAGNAIYDVAKRAFAALKDFTLGAIQTQDEMGKTAQKLGLTVKEFSELRHIAELSGVEVGQLSTGVGILSKNMLEAARGSKTQREAFAALGVEFRNQDGTLRSANVVLEDIADRFQQMPDSATKTALSLTILGRSGKEMIPFLNQGGAGLRAMRGLRPIVEIMTVNFSLLALDQIMNNAATILHMSGGQFNIPLVIQTATGGGRTFYSITQTAFFSP